MRRTVEEAGLSFPGQAGLVYLELEGDVRAEYRPERSFEAASLVKLPLLVELYRRAEAGELSLDEAMVFEERFRVGGSGSLKDQPAGTSWKLGDLARRMIVESDNVATDMLLERLGAPSVEAAMGRLGLRDTTVRRRIFDFEAIDQGRDNLTSPRDMALLLSRMGRGELPGSAEMLEILRGQRRRDMIPARLPAGTRVAHKTGELTGVLHDVGLVEAPEAPYVLVLMGQGFPDREEALAAWAEASGRIWRARPAGVGGTPAVP